MSTKNEYLTWVNSERKNSEGPTEDEFRTALHFADAFLEERDKLEEENKRLRGRLK